MTENALPGFDLPDPITMAAAIDPSIAEYRDYRVDVTTGEGLARGITVVDVLGVTSARRRCGWRPAPIEPHLSKC